MDRETGLYCYRNRYYSPELGRFIRLDRIWYPVGQANLQQYQYVDARPLNVLNPFGLEPRPLTTRSEAWDNGYVLTGYDDSTARSAAYAGVANEAGGRSAYASEAQAERPDRKGGAKCPFIEYGDAKSWHAIWLGGHWKDGLTVVEDPLVTCRNAPCARGERFCESYVTTYTESADTIGGQTMATVYLKDVAGRCGKCDTDYCCESPWTCGKTSIYISWKVPGTGVRADECRCRGAID